MHKIISKTALILATLILTGCLIEVYPQQKINPNQSIDIELTSSAPKTFLFDGTKGDFVEFVLTHKSTSLKVTVTSPSRRKVMFLVSSTLFNGTLPVPVHIIEPGVYRLRVEADRPGNAVGKVNINYASNHVFGTTDEDRLRAFTLISGAHETIQSLMELFIDRSRRDIARKNLVEAISICEKLGDRRCTAMASIDLGQLEFYEFANFAESEPAFRRAVREYAALADVSGESIAKGTMALVISLARGRDSEVVKLLDESINLADSINDPFLLSRNLTIKGRILRDWNEGTKGLEIIKQALSLTRDGDLEGKLRALIYASSISNLLNDRSYKLYAEQMFSISDEITGRFHPISTPYIFVNRAAFAVQKGDLKAYERFTDRSIAAAEALGQKRALGIYLWGAATDYLDLNMPEKARSYAERSVKLYEEVDPRAAQAGYSVLGRYHLMTGNPLKAKELLTKAVILNDANKDRDAAIFCLNLLSDAELKLGNIEKALEAAQKSYAYTLELRGNYYTTASLKGFDTTVLQYSSEKMIAALFRMYEVTRNNRYLDQALEIQDTALSQSLLNAVRNSGFDVTTALDSNLLGRLSSLQTIISETDSKIGGKQKDNSDFSGLLLKYLVEYDELLDQIRKTNPNWALLSESPYINADKIRALLDEETVLVQFSIESGESHVWVIAKDNSNFYRISGGKQIVALAEAFTKEASDYSRNVTPSNTSKGEKLFEAILKPISAHLKNFKRVLIVPDYSLLSVPFGAIPVTHDGKKIYFAEQMEINILPSVSTLLAIRDLARARPKVHPDNLLAVVADPIFDNSDERFKSSFILPRASENTITTVPQSVSQMTKLTRLPFTSVEAREVTGLVPGKSKTFSGMKAQRDAIMTGQLSDYRIVHFATHGFLNAENPELSSLALSMYDESGKATNGLLRALDIYSLRLKADMVVLSGCQTVGVAKTKGDYLVGMTRGFMYAGVPTVVASLWKVDDSATSYFMKYFYEALLTEGMTPTAALRDAQRRFINSPRWKAPKYWAAFTVQGEYNVTFK